MHRTRVGVLRGGPSPEYDVSLKSGQSILNTLPAEDFNVTDVFISKDGVWHVHGLPISEAQAADKFDVFFNALHGRYGEDGTLQGILDSLGARYTGSGKLASLLAMNKASAKRAFKMAGIKTAAHIVIALQDDGNLIIERDGVENFSHIDQLADLAREIFLTFPQPAVIKPLDSGSSVDVHIVHGASEIASALTSVLENNDNIIIEEFIRGVEATCGVIDGFREKENYVLPPVEILPPKENKFFNFDAKYSGKSQEICPGRFPRDVKEQLEHVAKTAHYTLGLRHYSCSDFIVTPKGSVYILETNSLPGLTPESLLPKGLIAVGSSLEEFASHIVRVAQD